MNTKIKITDAMVELAFEAFYANISAVGAREGIRRALEAALNPPPVICTNCGYLLNPAS